jgi:N-acyl amino acid synthase of PEP-CTERM/exosortase system
MPLLESISQSTLTCSQSTPTCTAKMEPVRIDDSALESTLAEFYWSWFEARTANSEDLRDVAFRLRYRVYCIENPFEDPSANPDGRETDEYDDHSTHSLLIYRPTGTPAGTVRLVLPTPHDLDRSFTLQRVCSHPLLRDRARFPVERTAEVSRFCISKEFRRRWGDGSCVGGEISDGLEMSAEEERRILPHLSLGLIESLVRTSVENGITHWCAVMEPTLLRLLTRLGIHFEPIGPLIEYHGRRQPCYIPLNVLLPRVKRERPDVWDVITRGGRHWASLRRLVSEHSMSLKSNDRDWNSEVSSQSMIA